MKEDNCCEGCRWWKYLSPTQHDGVKACHIFLETGIRNGKKGNRCSTRREGKRRRRGTGREGEGG